MSELGKQAAASEWMKHSAGKPKPTMLPARALLEVAKVMEHGAKKYSEDNWRKSPSARPYVDAALRHLLHQGAEETPIPDMDSLLPALAHAAASCLIALELAMGNADLARADVERKVIWTPPVAPGDERG